MEVHSARRTRLAQGQGAADMMCVALPPTHVGGCTLYVGRSTMDDEFLKIIDFEGKLMIRG